MTPVVLAASCCFVLTTVLEAALVPVLRWGDIVDVPGERSSHGVPTPRGGGIALILGTTVAAQLLVPGQTSDAFLLAVVGMGALGAAEDVRGLRIRTRLLGQAGVAVGVAALLVSSPAAPAPCLVVTTVFLLVVLTNATNFIDGINGLASASALLAALAYLAMASALDAPSLAGSAVLLAAAASAFLPWNAGRARVFLGDSGSYALGAGVAMLAAGALAAGAPPELAVSPAAVVAGDVGLTLVRRVAAGADVFSAHRCHVYQRLCAQGLSHQRTTTLAVLASALVVLFACASLSDQPALRIVGDVAAAGVVATYLLAPAYASRWSGRDRLGA